MDNVKDRVEEEVEEHEKIEKVGPHSRAQKYSHLEHV